MMRPSGWVTMLSLRPIVSFDKWYEDIMSMLPTQSRHQ